MTYQTDEKNLTIFPEYFVGVVKIAINRYNNRFLLRVFTNYLLTYLLNVTSKKLFKCHVYEFLGHPGLHHIPTMSCTFRCLNTTSGSNTSPELMGCSLHERPGRPPQCRQFGQQCRGGEIPLCKVFL